MLNSQVIQLASQHPHYNFDLLSIISCKALVDTERKLVVIEDVTIMSNSVNTKTIEVARLLPISIPQKVFSFKI